MSCYHPNIAVDKVLENLAKMQVGLVDVNRSTRIALEFFFSTKVCTNAELCETPENAKLLIADSEVVTSNDFFKQLNQNNQYAIILYTKSKKLTTTENILWLQKPINPTGLIKAIDSIYNTINSHQSQDKPVEPTTLTTTAKHNSRNSHLLYAVKKDFSEDEHTRYKAHKHVGSNKDIHEQNTENDRLITLTSNKYLYHYLIRAKNIAINNNSDVVIKTKFGKILFNNTNNLIYFDLDKQKLRLIQTTPIFENTSVSLVTLDLVK
ncbi:hypothetical protein MNBD_GAMMA01-1895, partial [hydrothermal vent metagenome]